MISAPSPSPSHTRTLSQRLRRRFTNAATTAFAAILAVFASAHFSSAQTARPNTPPPPIAVSFSALTLDENTITDLKYDSAGRRQDIRIPAAYKPRAVFYSGPNPLVFYKESKDAQGNPVKVAVMQVAFPQASGTYLVLVKEVSPGKYVTRAIRDDPTPASGNSWRFINLSRRATGFEFVEFKKQLVLKSGESSLVALGPKAGYSDGVAYLPDPKNPKKWAMGHATRYYFTPGRPLTIFILDDPSDPGHLYVKGLESDTSGAKKANAKANAPGNPGSGRSGNAQ